MAPTLLQQDRTTDQRYVDGDRTSHMTVRRRTCASRHKTGVGFMHGLPEPASGLGDAAASLDVRYESSRAKTLYRKAVGN